MYKVKEFRFLSEKDDYSISYQHWSKAYEYQRAVKKIRYKDGLLHNMSCGISDADKKFMSRLENGSRTVINTDVYDADLNVVENINNYQCDNIVEPYGIKSDMAMCIGDISSLHADNTSAIIRNIMMNTKEAVFTFKHPKTHIHRLEVIIGATCQDVLHRLNGANSIYPKKKYLDTNIILLHLSN